MGILANPTHIARPLRKLRRQRSRCHHSLQPYEQRQLIEQPSQARSQSINVNPVPVTIALSVHEEASATSWSPAAAHTGMAAPPTTCLDAEPREVEP